MTNATDESAAELRAERAFLAAARAALRGMRQQVVDTDTPLSDAEETDEIWHNTGYQLARARRARASWSTCPTCHCISGGWTTSPASSPSRPPPQSRTGSHGVPATDRGLAALCEGLSGLTGSPAP